MLGDISVATNIYIVTGYTDYPRRIIIREVSCKCFAAYPRAMHFGIPRSP